MRRPKGVRRVALAAPLCSLVVLLFPASGGADSASLRQKAEALREQNISLAEESHSALVELYALDNRLTAAESRVEALRSELDALRREQASVRRRLEDVRRLLVVSERNLGKRLVTIYEQGEPDALGVLLGATSIRDALTDFEHLHAIAGQDRNMIEQARKARASLRRLTSELARRQDRLQGLEQEAAAAVAALAEARAERGRYLDELASRRRLNERQIGSLESQARAAERRSSELAAREALAPTPTPALPVSTPSNSPSAAGRALTVVATAYSGAGGTATGLPTGPGIVAVDPTVIPFGTHMTIPGYGEGVAADTGSAIKGARIDVWVPTEADAEQWGVKTITIYLHD